MAAAAKTGSAVYRRRSAGPPPGQRRRLPALEIPLSLQKVSRALLSPDPRPETWQASAAGTSEPLALSGGGPAPATALLPQLRPAEKGSGFCGKNSAATAFKINRRIPAPPRAQRVCPPPFLGPKPPARVSGSAGFLLLLVAGRQPQQLKPAKAGPGSKTASSTPYFQNPNGPEGAPARSTLFPPQMASAKKLDRGFGFGPSQRFKSFLRRLQPCPDKAEAAGNSRLPRKLDRKLTKVFTPKTWKPLFRGAAHRPWPFPLKPFKAFWEPLGK